MHVEGPGLWTPANGNSGLWWQLLYGLPSGGPCMWKGQAYRLQQMGIQGYDDQRTNDDGNSCMDPGLCVWWASAAKGSLTVCSLHAQARVHARVAVITGHLNSCPSHRVAVLQLACCFNLGSVDPGKPLNPDKHFIQGVQKYFTQSRQILHTRCTEVLHSVRTNTSHKTSISHKTLLNPYISHKMYSITPLNPGKHFTKTYSIYSIQSKHLVWDVWYFLTPLNPIDSQDLKPSLNPEKTLPTRTVFRPTSQDLKTSLNPEEKQHSYMYLCQEFGHAHHKILKLHWFQKKHL